MFRVSREETGKASHHSPERPKIMRASTRPRGTIVATGRERSLDAEPRVFNDLDITDG